MKDYEKELERSFRTINEGDIVSGSVIAVVGLIAIVELQYVWLVNTYKLTRENVMRQSHELFKDAGLQFGENNIQVLLIYDKESENMSTCQPGDLRQELNNVAFKSHLGEFAFYSFEPSDMAGRDELFLESLRVVADAKDVKRLIAVPAEEEYGNEVPAILNKVDGKDGMTVFGMNPPTEAIAYQWEMLGFAVLQALGIKADEL